MSDQPSPRDLGSEDVGVDTQQLKAILAHSTQKRAASLVKEAREEFDQERKVLKQEIETLRLLVQEQHGKLAEEKARSEQLERELAELSQTLESEESLQQSYQQFDGALAELDQGRGDLLALLQRQQDEINELLTAQTGALEVRLRELAVPTETRRPGAVPAAAATPVAEDQEPALAPVAVPDAEAQKPAPAAIPVAAATRPAAVSPQPAAVALPAAEPVAVERDPEPPSPPTSPSKQMSIAAVLARAREVMAPRSEAAAPRGQPAGGSTMGMAEINEWMSGARQKKAAAEQQSANAGQTMMMKALTPEQIEQVQAERQQAQTERRRLPRRAGNPVQISIEGPGDPPEAMQGLVLDRSQAGVGIRVAKAQQVGAVLKIRAGQGAWVQVEVRYCILDGKSYRIGCQFAKRCPWGEIQQFG